MQFLYSLSIYFFRLAMWVATPFVPKAQHAVKGRKHWEENLKAAIDANKDWIWMHCSSLGEFEQGRPVLEALKQKYPQYKFALSFFSPSGYLVRKDYKGADVVFYLPLDTPSNAKKLAQILKPKLWILSKYDYWYNHLKYQKAAGTKIGVISAIFRPNQIYFKPYGKWFARQLQQYVDRFFVQEEQSQSLLKQINITQVTVAGDTRLDRVKTIASKMPQLGWVDTFKADSKLVVVGSSWKEDQDLWVTFINHQLPLGWKVMVAPHEIDAKKIAQLKQALHKETLLYSQLETQYNNIKDVSVIIVDTIGLLSKIYAYADMAYVGGGFNKSGVHNTLEPTVFGTPVIIGPNFKKFKEVVLLKEEGVIFSISNYKEFEEVVLELMHNKDKRLIIKERAHAYFNAQLPSTQIILETLSIYL